jgi:hypothetical protein
MNQETASMSTHATCNFEIKTWDEQPYHEAEDGTKLVRASVTATYSGDIVGESTLEYLMYYGAASVSFIGLERITGQLGGRAGSFVLEHKGVYADGEAQGVFTVVDGSGAGDLRGLRGTGNLGAQHGPAGNVTLDYDFA